jgi:hypothetical protein
VHIFSEIALYSGVRAKPAISRVSDPETRYIRLKDILKQWSINGVVPGKLE